MQLTVASLKKDRTAFKTEDGVWHNYGFKGDKGPLEGVEPGAVLNITDYNDQYKQFKSFTVVSAGKPYEAKPKTGGFHGKSNGFQKDPNAQTMIVRQNALTNLSNLIIAGKVQFTTIADLASKAKELAEYLVGDLTGSVAKAEPTTQPAAKPVVKPKPASSLPAYDDDIPF